ncbi:terminase gpA endonuclease subunit [Niveispirillum sp.]|uniref:phage terminase large subunit family protein n=1 Tax=Niveispirillum sp. TaxID=1917217 RepID=UPI001B778938|nr:terminase gpA endonuclease subunit [Niveispirillum sp.]MBP7339422.1 phage terminase large subunit family protein [Niveispirillum sp.]
MERKSKTPSSTLRSRFPHLADGLRGLLEGFASGIRPRVRRSVDVWAQQERYVSPESGSPYALDGKVRWNNDNSPHMVEPQQCLSLDDPCFLVAMRASAQSTKTEAGINLIGQVIHEDPSPILVLLPSIDESRKFAKIKLGPTIDVTPALTAKVREQKGRDEDGSTTSMKKFRGGYAIIAPASTPKPLQMVSYRIVIAEEVTGYPKDVGGRGDPLDQAIARTKTYREYFGAKVYVPSTPGLKGTCRITALFEAGDMRMRYVPCPECGAYQQLLFKNLHRDRDKKPFGAHFVCAAKGCRIDFKHRDRMVANDRAVWLKTYPRQEHDEDGVVDGDIGPPGEWIPAEAVAAYRARGSGGREPSFHIWQAYALTSSWDLIVGEFLDIGNDAEKAKTFCQQTLGEPYEPKGDAPEVDKLLACVETFPFRTLPDGALFVTGFCDVQGYALKWCAYAWGRGMEFWRIDGGIIEGDPTRDDVWVQLSGVIKRRYVDQHGQGWGFDAFGVDTGFTTHRVYKFVRDLKRAGYERVFACDGRGGPKLPAIGTPTKVSINWQGQKLGTTLLWPVGTWGQKEELFGALARMVRSRHEPMAPDGKPWSGLGHFNRECDRAFFEELTNEYMHISEQRGKVHREWRKKGTNDRLDAFVGSRALAAHVIGETAMTDADWELLILSRRPKPRQGDLLEGVPSLPYRLKVQQAPLPPPPAPVAEGGPAPEPPPPAAIVPSVAAMLDRRRQAQARAG